MRLMFPMHTFYWGDWYKQIVGPEQAARISPMRSILKTGLHATSHTDAPVALPNLMQVAWATVNRTSRSGAVIGPDERVTPHDRSDEDQQDRRAGNHQEWEDCLQARAMNRCTARSFVSGLNNQLRRTAKR